MRRFIRYRSLSGGLRSDSTTRTFATRESPFIASDPALLNEAGYIQGENGQYRFLSPDAALLLSDGFLETHCFRLVRPGRDMPDAVGLGFEPVKGRKVPEIKGTLWVDRASAELRTLTYEYVNVPSAVRAEGLGGRLEFQRLPGGSWIIRDWYIRMPDRVDLQRRPAARRQVAAQADTIVGFVDNGGTARPRGDASVQLSEAAARTTQATVILRDVRIRVTSSAGTPIEGALIAVAELDTTITTGPGGHAVLSDVSSSRLRLRLRAIGHSPLSAVILREGHRRQFDTTFTMTATVQQLDSIVVTEKPDLFRLGKMEGFERRRKEGFGRFLTMEQLHDPLRPTLDQQLRRFGRIRLMPCGFGYAAASSVGGAPPGQLATCRPPYVDDVCYMSVYLDGALYYSNATPGPPLDLSRMNILNFQALEVYRSPAEMPVEYNATGSGCGVILPGRGNFRERASSEPNRGLPVTGLLLLVALQSIPDSLVSSGVIAGVVTDLSHRPIQRAIVGLTPGPLETKTDRDGRFTFKNLDAGTYALSIRALGYQGQIVQVALDAAAGSWRRVPLAMAAQQLPELAVKVNEWKPAEYAPTTKYDGFFERKRKGSGTFIDRDEIERLAPHHITQLFQVAPGFHVRLQPAGTPGSTTPTTVRIARCPGTPPPMAIYLDGMRLRWGPQKSMAQIDPNQKPPWIKDEPEDFASEKFAELLDDINPRNIEMIEIYRGVSQIPAEFDRDVCAVVAIWTRWNQ